MDPNVTKTIGSTSKEHLQLRKLLGRRRPFGRSTVQRVFPTIQTIRSFFLWGSTCCVSLHKTVCEGYESDLGTGELGEAIARQKPNQPLVIEGHVVRDGAIQFASPSRVDESELSQYPHQHCGSATGGDRDRGRDWWTSVSSHSSRRLARQEDAHVSSEGRTRMRARYIHRIAASTARAACS